MKRTVKRHDVVQPLDQSIRLIALTQNKNVIVDAEDYEWLNQWNWHISSSGTSEMLYAATGGGILLHRMLMRVGSDKEIDHINGDGLDDRKANLRPATRAENVCNTLANLPNKTKYRGIVKIDNGYSARICMRGKRLYLGYFKTQEEASAAYEIAAKEIKGAFYVSPDGTRAIHTIGN